MPYTSLPIRPEGESVGAVRRSIAWAARGGMMGEIHGLHHAQSPSPPGTEGEARAFDCDVWWLAELEKPAALADRGGLWLRVGSQEVHVGTEPGVDRTATKAHLAYAVADLAWWRVRL